MINGRRPENDDGRREIPELWRTVPGAPDLRDGGVLQVSNLGGTAILRADGTRETVTQHLCRNHGGTLYSKVSVYAADGKRKALMVSRMVWRAFVGEIGAGKNIVHRNGMKADNRVDNLMEADCRECGSRYGWISGHRGVAKIDRAGNVLAWFRSTAEAQRNEHLNRTAIADRCNRKLKRFDEYELTGYTYRWADEIE